MATWPHEETILTGKQKSAYRYLLYQAMLDIRMLCPSPGVGTWNLFEWGRQYRRSRVAGAIADWLHNLAQYSASDFRGFDADWLWQEYDGLCGRYSQFGPNGFPDYRQRFADHLARLEAQNTSQE